MQRYWLCLLLTEPSHKAQAAQTAWGAASAVYQSITLTVSPRAPLHTMRAHPQPVQPVLCAHDARR